MDERQPAATFAGLNGFSAAAIPKTFKNDFCRFLIVADMFHTGHDNLLLHPIYTRCLRDITAVQTIIRLHRACPKKYDTFVLDFFNVLNNIIEVFSRYYQTTLLSSVICSKRLPNHNFLS